MLHIIVLRLFKLIIIYHFVLPFKNIGSDYADSGVDSQSSSRPGVYETVQGWLPFK